MVEVSKPQREDSETEFWRRQEERYKQDQQNREKQEEELRRKEEEEAAKLQEERERVKRDLEERERAERERREAAERERRERERKEEMERKEREERERERKEKEERERKEAELENQRREEELQANKVQERLEMEARLAEEQRKKEELLRRLQQMDGSSDKTQHSSDPFAPSASATGRGGDPFAPSPSKRKDYVFTQSVENLHKGKPSHDHVQVPYIDRQKKKADDSDIGGYQPSFVSGPVKTTTMKQKKPLSLFDDDEPPKPAANPAAGTGDKKSRLMADLFGSQTTSDTKKDGDDLFSSSRPAPRPAVQNKRAPAFPWDDPLPSSNKPKEPEKRESSALFGGGAAVIDDHEDTIGHSGPKSNLLPRRPRQTATTFSSKPAVLAVDSFDDDIEEVVL